MRRGFTLIELLVVVAIIALLIAILLPSLARAREQAKRAACGVNQHQIAIALHAYATSERGRFPYGLQTFSPTFGPPSLGNVLWTGTLKVGQGGAPASEKFNDLPAYINLYFRKYAQAPKLYYCPSQEKFKYGAGGKEGWPSTDIVRNDTATWGFSIGYNFWANHWMGKGNKDALYEYPDNWQTHGLLGQVGESTTDSNTSERMLVSDIMSDLRSRATVIKAHLGPNEAGPNIAPDLSFNSHGGPLNFLGGNVTYLDGGTQWRSRQVCEGDFIADWQRYKAKQISLQGVRHMVVISADLPNIPSSKMNVYW